MAQAKAEIFAALKKFWNGKELDMPLEITIGTGMRLEPGNLLRFSISDLLWPVGSTSSPALTGNTKWRGWGSARARSKR